ncbi:hypothetical protein [Rhizobium ruizarguesonis]|uniref:hypothetical protein n=1 Tax=Rhizobium ruizarguesonis TaxID=2081791 RepID=UPI0013C06EA7|nr:hypothetical protein [Rhizobium ruizarguesonis]NEI96388.1 hypothetical protein [Rhizobium ruizarguesonis]NEJ33989.1 hypothetical protein [Rhizobium ruizarguesonis]
MYHLSLVLDLFAGLILSLTAMLFCIDHGFPTLVTWLLTLGTEIMFFQFLIWVDRPKSRGNKNEGTPSGVSPLRYVGV